MDQGDAIKTSYPVQRVVFFILILGLLLPVFGCHHRQGEGNTLPEGKVVFDRIAIVPFQQLVPEGPSPEAVRCPLCGRIFEAARIEGAPETLVEELFLEGLKARKPGWNIIAGERVAGAYRRVATASLKEPLSNILQDMGKELGVEGVVVGYLYRFRERKGESFSVEQPASVAFDIHLIRVEDGVLVWRSAFDRTQGSLMENLLQFSYFLKERGRWLKAKELAEEGVNEVLEGFPGLP